MSDSLRKGFGEQAQEKITPQSQKGYGQIASENLSGAADKVFGSVEGNKSTTQKAGDTVRGAGDDAQSNGGSFLDSTKKTVTDAGASISNTLSGAAGNAQGKASDVSKQ